MQTAWAQKGLDAPSCTGLATVLAADDPQQCHDCTDAVLGHTQALLHSRTIRSGSVGTDEALTTLRHTPMWFL